MKDKKVVFLFFAHQITDTILKRYQCLQKAGSLYGDVYFVFHKQDDCIIPAGLNPYIFTYNTLNQLPFKAIRETIVPGSAHFPLLQFYRDFPVYDYYWIIEYDVVFNGDWSFFLDYFSHIDADLLTSRVRSFKEDKYWYWWNTLRLTNKRIEKDKLLASFNPIYRLSGKALILLNKCLSEGDGGHNEVIIPTLLNYENYKILDFGGRGNFVPQGSEDKFYLCEDDLYIWGTMRHKPSFKEDEIYLPNMLYHPVK